MFRVTRAGRGGDSTRGPAFTVSSEAHRQERIRGAHRRARGRLAGAAVAAVAVVLLGSACGQYAYAHRDQTTPVAQVTRSEEHTSELQSRENLVCRLLLEKKK